MKTAYVRAQIEHDEFMFDSNQNDIEVIKDFYNKRLKNIKIDSFKIYVEDDEDYDEEKQEYGLAEYTIKDGKII